MKTLNQLAEEILELTSTTVIHLDGLRHRWGMDTDCGTNEQLIKEVSDKIKAWFLELIKEESSEESGL